METSQKKIIVANWKMNPTSWAEAEGLLDAVNEQLESRKEENKFSLVICPPFVFLEEVSKILDSSRVARNTILGAQDIALAESGAWTGEVSGPMLKRLGVQYVIIGHSERRWKLGETDDVVNKKIKTALHNELTPIVCVGEKVRDENFAEFLKNQINATLEGLSEDEKGKCLIAYEPVWAISSNPGARPDTPEETLKSIAIIKEIIPAATVLYGGSVNSENVKSFLDLSEISGVLVGSASVNKEEFIKMLALV